MLIIGTDIKISINTLRTLTVYVHALSTNRIDFHYVSLFRNQTDIGINYTI